MCGIFGIFSDTPLPAGTETRLSVSLATLKHRGPDETTRLVCANALFGFNRLTIVGLTNGSQPIKNEQGSVYLVCNGEIYNHQQLKQKQVKKHRFTTDSDVEVVLHHYEDTPNSFVTDLEGQFAFVIYDTTKQQVVLARDRFGIHPLYYAFDSQHKLYVASEIKAIMTSNPDIRGELDTLALKETYYLYGPTPPRTCVKKVYQVQPGHVCVYDLRQKRIISDSAYWQLPKSETRSVADLRAGFKYFLTEAVRKRTQGDLPRLGAYISGGVDSGVVAALLTKTGKKLTSFSVRFENQRYNEAKYQDMLSNYLHIQNVFCYGDNLIDDNLLECVWHIEHPFIRTTPMPLFRLASLVQKQGIKYVCCGEGADEMILGYPVFQDNLSSVEAKLPQLITMDHLFKNELPSGKALVEDIISTIAKQTPDTIRQKQLIEINTKLSRFLLVQQGDRMSLSHGVEQRFPYLDERLVDFLFSIPQEQFSQLAKQKKLLTDFAADLLPQPIANRPKQGYLAPLVEDMYRSSAVHRLTAKREGNEFIDISRHYFEPSPVNTLLDKFKRHNLSPPEAIAFLVVLTTYLLHCQYNN